MAQHSGSMSQRGDVATVRLHALAHQSEQKTAGTHRRVVDPHEPIAFHGIIDEVANGQAALEIGNIRWSEKLPEPFATIAPPGVARRTAPSTSVQAGTSRTAAM